MDNFRWTTKSEQAAREVAEDILTNEQIARRAGISSRGLDKWKAHPEFAARVQEIVRAFREAARAEGVAIVENRIARLNADWKSLRTIQRLRAETATRRAETLRALEGKTDDPLELHEEFPGMMTGNVIKVVTPVKNGDKIEYQVDTSLLGELRAIEQQTAKELGQWSEKAEITHSGEQVVKVLKGVSMDDL